METRFRSCVPTASNTWTYDDISSDPWEHHVILINLLIFVSPLQHHLAGFRIWISSNGIIATFSICCKEIHQPCSWIHSHALPLRKKQRKKTNGKEKINPSVLQKSGIEACSTYVNSSHVMPHESDDAQLKQQGQKKIRKNWKDRRQIERRIINRGCINHSSGAAWWRSGGWCRAWPSCPWEICSASHLPHLAPNLHGVADMATNRENWY
jgi:hypothetical protein